MKKKKFKSLSRWEHAGDFFNFLLELKTHRRCFECDELFPKTEMERREVVCISGYPVNPLWWCDSCASKE